MTNDIKVYRYRVWLEGEKPEDGSIIEAADSFRARRSMAEWLGISVLNVMARREDDD